MKRTLAILLCMVVASFGFGQQRSFRNGIFLHHSTGACIWGPNGSNTNMPQQIAIYNAQHGYTGVDSVSMQEEIWPPDIDNEWWTWHRIFNNTSSSDIRPFFAANRIIVIKSCFPSSDMKPEIGEPADTLYPYNKKMYNYKWHWRNFVNVMRQNTNNFFVVWTNAPLTDSTTDSQVALFSDQFCRWAKDTLARGLDPEFGPFPANVYVFDFFHKVAGVDGMLKPQYATSPLDPHPNSAGTELVAPQFVKEIFDAAIAYELTVSGAPMLASPPDGALNQPTSLPLIWKATAGASSYHVQMATDPGFAALLLDDSTIVDTSRVLIGLPNDTHLYWRVRAKKISGTSAFTPSWSFTTIVAAPRTPVLASPPNGALSQPTTLWLTWRESPGAATYHIQVASDTGFTTVVSDDSTVADTTKLLTSLGNNAQYYWRVNAKNTGGTSLYSIAWNLTTNPTGVGPAGGLPTHYSLDQNYPNPFNPTTTIMYSVQSSGFVTLKVYDVLGREVATLVERLQTPGYYAVQFDAAGLGSGVYYYILRAGNSVATKSMVVLK